MDKITLRWIGDVLRFMGVVSFVDGMMEAFYFLETTGYWKSQITVWILNITGVLLFCLGSWIYNNNAADNS